MKLKTNNKTYACVGFRGGGKLAFDMAEEPVLGQELVLLSDDGFTLRSVTVADWAHRWFEHGTLVLSHTEKPLPPPAPIDPPVSAPTEMELAQQEITELQLNDIEQGQAITEMELLILGGTGRV